ncbi:MAG: aminodeoxychorismate synthase component I [Deltaproteobacteria bacterium]|nr:aminodeoxychorismate synthase component I [Deltaproteobacteria bacterium]
MASHELEYTTPALVAFARLRQRPGLFWVDAATADGASFMGFAPVAQLHVHTSGRVERFDASGEAHACHGGIAEIERFVAEAAVLDGSDPPPRTIGFFGYDLGPLLEPHVRAPGPSEPWLPAAWLGRYDAVLACHPIGALDGPCRLVVHATDDGAAKRLIDAIDEASDADADLESARRALPAGRLLELPSEAPYASALERALDYIAAGDVYQVNLTGRFRVASAADPAEVYVRLREAQPVPHGFFLDCGPFQVLGRSPERFVRVRGHAIRTEPIKGTRPRHGDLEDDLAAVAELRADPKERAEHVMIVDLERNDLGRLCRAGSVRVSSLLRVESFATLHHLVSTVEGRLETEVDLASILRSTFPGGSITGAPKIRATQVIAELETQARGVYTGALAWFRSPRDFDSAIAIRTAVAHEGVLAYHAGGGIVADSDPEKEYAECWLKARVFLDVLLGASAAERAFSSPSEAPAPGRFA